MPNAALEEQQAAWEAQKASVQHSLDDRVAGLDALQVDLQSQQIALEKERRSWQSQCHDAATDQSTKARQLADREAELEVQHRAWRKNWPTWKARRPKPGVRWKLVPCNCRI